MAKNNVVDELDTRSFKDSAIDLMISNNAREDMEFKSHKEIENELNRELVLKALRSRGPMGATSSEIAEITKMSQVTSRKHLEDLCKIREAYKLKRGKHPKKVSFAPESSGGISWNKNIIVVSTPCFLVSCRASR